MPDAEGLRCRKKRNGRARRRGLFAFFLTTGVGNGIKHRRDRHGFGHINDRDHINNLSLVHTLSRKVSKINALSFHLAAQIVLFNLTGAERVTDVLQVDIPGNEDGDIVGNAACAIHGAFEDRNVINVLILIIRTAPRRRHEHAVNCTSALNKRR